MNVFVKVLFYVNRKDFMREVPTQRKIALRWRCRKEKECNGENRS